MILLEKRALKIKVKKHISCKKYTVQKTKNIQSFFPYVITFRKKPCSTRILEILTYLNNKTKKKRDNVLRNLKRF